MASRQSCDEEGAGGSSSSLAEVDITETGDGDVDLEDPRERGTAVIAVQYSTVQYGTGSLDCKKHTSKKSGSHFFFFFENLRNLTYCCTLKMGSPAAATLIATSKYMIWKNGRVFSLCDVMMSCPHSRVYVCCFHLCIV